MKVKSIAECSKGSILQYFWPALSNAWSWQSIFGLFESGRFTQVTLCVCYFPIGILGQVWYLIISIPDLCTLSYFTVYQMATMTVILKFFKSGLQNSPGIFFLILGRDLRDF